MDCLLVTTETTLYVINCNAELLWEALLSNGGIVIGRVENGVVFGKALMHVLADFSPENDGAWQETAFRLFIETGEPI